MYCWFIFNFIVSFFNAVNNQYKLPMHFNIWTAEISVAFKIIVFFLFFYTCIHVCIHKLIFFKIYISYICMFTASNGAFGVIAMWSVGCPFRSGWFANLVSLFAFVVIKGPSLIKIISARNQDIIMVYEAVIKVDIYGVGLANTRAQL